MKNIKNIMVNSLAVLVMILSSSCNQKNNERINTPYGVAFIAEDLNSVTDKEIEYFIIGEDFIYMFNGNAGHSIPPSLG